MKITSLSTADEYITINSDMKKAVVSNIFIKSESGEDFA